MTGQHPRLRSHTRRRKSGKVTTYYFYDRRPEGLPDVPLGRDYEKAVEKWREIHERQPRIAGTLMEAFEDWEKDEVDGLLSYKNKDTQRSYRRQLGNLKPVFGESTWSDIELSDLRGYLKRRSAKTQGNREMSVFSLVWNWARLEGYTKLPWPAAGMERSSWKNPERARVVEVSDDAFDVIYEHADQVLRDCMDIATATGMRLTDCREVLLPKGDMLRLEASKTGKAADFDLALSKVLPGLLARRRTIKADHLMLLTTWGKTPRAVSEGMLTNRWDAARGAACDALRAIGDEESLALAATIGTMYLRDMRKRAADLAASEDAAAELLQHSDKRLTARHYRTKATILKPVR